MADAYTVRIGTRKTKRPASDLYGIPFRNAEDDGARSYWGPSADRSWNDGVCGDCSGVLRWAEAGYVPWHRICERCGSHWDMHPVLLYVRKVPAEGPANVPPSRRPHHVEVIRPDDPDADVDTRRHRNDSDWLHVLALVHPEHLTPEAVQHGAVYGGWARRAQFYG